MPLDPNDPELEDKHCNHVEDGKRCGGWHTRDSAFCNIHKEGIDVFNANRKKATQRAAALSEKLSEKDYSVRTIPDCQEVAEDVINGILKGVIKRDKAAPLAVFLGMAFSMAKAMHGQGQTNRLSVKILQQNNVSQIQMTHDQMDEFLRGDDSVKISLIEDMQKTGKLHVTQKADNVVDIEAKQVVPKDVKIDHAALESLTKNTNIPLDKKQIKSLFGRNMGDDTKPKPVDLVDPRGFEHMFQKGTDALPQEAQPNPHKYKGKYEQIAEDKVQLWFTCEYCGDRQGEIIKNRMKYKTCAKAPGRTDYGD